MDITLAYTVEQQKQDDSRSSNVTPLHPLSPFSPNPLSLVLGLSPPLTVRAHINLWPSGDVRSAQGDDVAAKQLLLQSFTTKDELLGSFLAGDSTKQGTRTVNGDVAGGCVYLPALPSPPSSSLWVSTVLMPCAGSILLVACATWLGSIKCVHVHP